MRSIKTATSIITATLVLVLAPATAAAQPSKAAAAKPAKASSSASASKTSASTGEEGYTYEFTDDPLGGSSSAALAARIQVRSQVARRTLIRPRLHFIPELYKSIEQI